MYSDEFVYLDVRWQQSGWLEAMRLRLFGSVPDHFVPKGMAVEDIGLADPQAQTVCLHAWELYERLGSPEGELALAQAVTYLALAPKSNAGYAAWKAAMREAKKTGSEPPPKHILNAPTKLMRDEGYGAGYAYDHDAEDGFSGQNYFPETMKRPIFYQPVERGFERELKKRLEYFSRLRERRGR